MSPTPPRRNPRPTRASRTRCRCDGWVAAPDHRRRGLGSGGNQQSIRHNPQRHFTMGLACIVLHGRRNSRFDGQLC